MGLASPVSAWACSLQMKSKERRDRSVGVLSGWKEDEHDALIDQQLDLLDGVPGDHLT